MEDYSDDEYIDEVISFIASQVFDESTFRLNVLPKFYQSHLGIIETDCINCFYHTLKSALESTLIVQSYFAWKHPAHKKILNACQDMVVRETKLLEALIPLVHSEEVRDMVPLSSYDDEITSLSKKGKRTYLGIIDFFREQTLENSLV